MTTGSGPEPSPTLARYAGMGVELAGAIIGLTLLGLWIDHRFGTKPKGVMIGAAIGIVGGMYNFIRQALELGKQQPGGSSGSKDSNDRVE